MAAERVTPTCARRRRTHSRTAIDSTPGRSYASKEGQPPRGPHPAVRRRRTLSRLRVRARGLRERRECRCSPHLRDGDARAHPDRQPGGRSGLRPRRVHDRGNAQQRTAARTPSKKAPTSRSRRREPGSSWSVFECPGTGACTIDVDSDRTVVATYTPTSLSVSVEGSDLLDAFGNPLVDAQGNLIRGRVRSADGLIDCSGSNDCRSLRYAAFAEVVLTASPASEFERWSAACQEAGTTATCTVLLSATTWSARSSATTDNPELIPPRCSQPSVAVEPAGSGTVNLEPLTAERGDRLQPDVQGPLPAGREGDARGRRERGVRRAVRRSGRAARSTARLARRAAASRRSTSRRSARCSQYPGPCERRRDGTPGRDLFDGGPGGERFVGRAGNDRLRGMDGDDCIDGSAGNDRLEGGNGNDRLNGGPGNDSIDGGPGTDTITAGNGRTSCSRRTAVATRSSAERPRRRPRGPHRRRLGLRARPPRLISPAAGRAGRS